MHVARRPVVERTTPAAHLRRSARPALLCVGVLLFFSGTISAQVLVSFDSAGRIFTVDSSHVLAPRLFPEPGFQDARLYQLADSVWSLEVTARRETALVRSVRSLDGPGFRSLRSFVDDVLAVRTPSAGPSVASAQIQPDGSGNNKFVQSFAGLGFAWYGWTLPAVIGEGAGSAGLALYLFTAAGSYFYADGYASGRSLSSLESDVFSYFAFRGVAHGLALVTVAMGSDIDIRFAVPAGTLVSLAEGFTMMNSVGSIGDMRSRFGGTTAFGDAGILAGLAGAFVIAGESDRIISDLETSPRRYAFGLLAGNAAGLAIGWSLSSGGRYAPGDATMQESVGYLGAMAGFTVADAGSARTERKHATGVLAGIVGGQTIGYLLAGSMDLSESDGRRAQLLTSAGVILGLGVVQAASPGEATRTTFLTAATVGGSLAMAYALSTSKGEPAAAATSSLETDLAALARPLVPVSPYPLVAQRPFATLRVRL